MYNKAFLIGRLVRDPESRVTESGITVARFTIAVDRIRGKGQEPVTDFIRVVTWRRLAEICAQYVKKGKLVAVEGRLQLSYYEKEGTQMQSAEIVADNLQMLDKVSQETSEFQQTTEA